MRRRPPRGLAYSLARTASPGDGVPGCLGRLGFLALLMFVVIPLGLVGTCVCLSAVGKVAAVRDGGVPDHR